MGNRLRYLAYLLRLWQVDQRRESAWRASLEDAHSNEIHGFTSLDDLFNFLRLRLQECSSEFEDEDDNIVLP
jgi:hypothetical protein